MASDYRIYNIIIPIVLPYLSAKDVNNLLWSRKIFIDIIKDSILIIPNYIKLLYFEECCLNNYYLLCKILLSNFNWNIDMFSNDSIKIIHDIDDINILKLLIKYCVDNKKYTVDVSTVNDPTIEYTESQILTILIEFYNEYDCEINTATSYDEYDHEYFKLSDITLKNIISVFVELYNIKVEYRALKIVVEDYYVESSKCILNLKHVDPSINNNHLLKYVLKDGNDDGSLYGDIYKKQARLIKAILKHPNAIPYNNSKIIEHIHMVIESKLSRSHVLKISGWDSSCYHDSYENKKYKRAIRSIEKIEELRNHKCNCEYCITNKD